MASQIQSSKSPNSLAMAGIVPPVFSIRVIFSVAAIKNLSLPGSPALCRRFIVTGLAGQLPVLFNTFFASYFLIGFTLFCPDKRIVITNQLNSNRRAFHLKKLSETLFQKAHIVRRDLICLLAMNNNNWRVITTWMCIA